MTLAVSHTHFLPTRVHQPLKCTLNLDIALCFIILHPYNGCPPKKKRKTEQSIFQDFALINSYHFSPCWIEHLFLIIITPRSSNLVENFLFYEWFLMVCHFRDFPDFQSSEARLMTASAVHKLTEYCVQWSVYCPYTYILHCLTRIYNPGTSLALRFLCSWLNAGMCWRMCCWSRH